MAAVQSLHDLAQEREKRPATRLRRPLAGSLAKFLAGAEPVRSYSAVPRFLQRMINKRQLQATDARVWAELDHRARGRGQVRAGSHEVAASLGVARSTVSLSFSRLVKAGLLHRVPVVYRNAQGQWRDGKALNVLVGGNRALGRARVQAANAEKSRSSPVSDPPDTKTFREEPSRPLEPPRRPVEPDEEPEGPLFDKATALAAMRATIRTGRPTFA